MVKLSQIDDETASTFQQSAQQPEKTENTAKNLSLNLTPTTTTNLTLKMKLCTTEWLH